MVFDWLRLTGSDRKWSFRKNRRVMKSVMMILTSLDRVDKTLTDHGPNRLRRTLPSLDRTEVAVDSDLAHFLLILVEF